MNFTDFIRSRLWDIYCYLKAWIHILDNVDHWLDWLESDPNSDLAPFDYWQFWNDLNGNYLNILFEDAKESFRSLYPYMEKDEKIQVQKANPNSVGLSPPGHPRSPG